MAFTARAFVTTLSAWSHSKLPSPIGLEGRDRAARSVCSLRDCNTIWGERKMDPIGSLGLPFMTASGLPRFPRGKVDDLVSAFIRMTDGSELGRATVKRIKNDPRFMAMENTLLSNGVGAGKVEASFLAAWWLWRVNETGKEKADEHLETFLDSEMIDAFIVLWVYGLEVQQSVEVIPDVRLVPCREMPASREQEMFLEGALPQFPVSVITPRSALLRKVRIRKLWTEEPQAEPRVGRDAQRQLHDVAILLNCLSDVLCVSGYATSYTPPDVPLGPFGGGGGGSPMHDFLPRKVTMANAEKMVPMNELFVKFAQHHPDSKKRITRAIERLTQAKSHLSYWESALDLGIVLEMLLLGKEHGQKSIPDQLSLQFRLRGSWLIEDEPRKRHDVYKNLNRIYSHRSQVAHTGFSKDLDEMDSAERGPLLRSHFSVAERIVQKLIISGFPSDWTQKILGA